MEVQLHYFSACNLILYGFKADWNAILFIILSFKQNPFKLKFAF